MRIFKASPKLTYDMDMGREVRGKQNNVDIEFQTLQIVNMM
jgi:hypothetical protein